MPPQYPSKFNFHGNSPKDTGNKDDDPDKTTNPKRLDLFWDGGNLVGRGVIVTNVVWDGETYAVSLRRAN